MRTEDELVSVVIPCFDRRATVGRAIDSVMAQQGVKTEILLCDDGSADGTFEDWAHDSRVRYLKLGHHGACAARNAGIDAAVGSWIAFLDSDDTWRPTKLKDQLELIERTGTDAVCSAFLRHDSGNTIQVPDISRSTGPIKPADLLGGNLVSTQTILGRVELIRKVRFDESLERFQDWDFAMRLSGQGRLWYDQTVTADVYLQSDSISKKPELGLRSLPVLYRRSSELYRSSVRGTLAWQDHVYMLTSGLKDDGRALYRLTYEKERTLTDRMRLRIHAAALLIRHHAVRIWRKRGDRRVRG